MKVADKVLQMLAMWQRPPATYEVVALEEHPLAPKRDVPEPVRLKEVEPMRPVSVVMDIDTFYVCVMETQDNTSLSNELRKKQIYGLPIHLTQPPHHACVLFIQVERMS